MQTKFVEKNRRMTKDEERLLEYLVAKASLNLPMDWKDRLLVAPIDGGGMGSLSLFLESFDYGNRIFGRVASDCSFLDVDDVPVIATLYLNKEGHLFELDMWKVDFEPLLRIPDNFNDLET